MYALIRLIASLLALVFGWTTVAVGLLGAYWYGWDYIAHMEIFAGAVSLPPPFRSLALASFVVPIFLLGLFLLMFTFLPARWVMELFIRNREHKRLPHNHPLLETTKSLANDVGVATPALYVYYDTQPNAWAFSTLMGSVVCVSLELVKQLSVDEQRWVISHELAHIKYFDAGTAAFWASTERVILLAWRGHRYVVNNTIRGIGATQAHAVIVALLALPILLFSYSAIVADYLARKSFLIIDRAVGRAMEYRADALGAKIVGVPAAISALEKLPNGVEPDLGLFATHPTTTRRLERLQELGLRLATDGSVESGV